MKPDKIYSDLLVHLDVLDERATDLKAKIKKRHKAGQYNVTELKRLLKQTKKAKSVIADMEYV
jgi:hypothetical protein